MEKREKILIIKTGYSEFLEGHKDSREVSFGDVIRVTPLLHLYKNDHVTWVTDIKAFPLLEKNPYINKLLRYDFTTVFQLLSEEFDRVINLEKVPGICALSDKIRARKSRYGFTLNTQTGKAEALDKASEALSISADLYLKRKNSKTFTEFLFEMVGEEWKKEEIVLGYKPKSEEMYDVGLNTTVGKKWPTKFWPKKYWDVLEKMLKDQSFKVSRQDSEENKKKGIMEDLEKYMDWINSCKIIVSCDTLGLHLGIALKKKVLGLFGPTPDREIYIYGQGKSILPRCIPDCLPCFKGVCKREKTCMEDISVEKIYNEVKILNEV